MIHAVLVRPSSRGTLVSTVAQLAEAHMNCHERIVRDPKTVGGEPVQKGTRVTLRTVLASRYAEQKAIVAIESLTVLEGQLSPRALGLVVEWGSAHRLELMEDWDLARRQQPLKRVAPLE